MVTDEDPGGRGAQWPLLAAKLGVTTGPVAAVGSVELEYVGYAIVALFVATWVVALAVWRIARIEQRWSAAASQPVKS